LKPNTLLPWPPKAVLQSGGFEATPAPVEGVITWNINTTCNYRCSYCTQRFLDDRARWSQDTEGFIRAFREKLPGVWEIKLSGGEPFQHPTLLEITRGLKDAGHFISVVTNFSAKEKQLEAFLDAAQQSLRVFSSSLHLEYVDNEAGLQAFAEKAKRVQARLEGFGAFHITCVATRQNLVRLTALKTFFEGYGLRFKVQPEKEDRDIIEYTEEEKAFLLSLGGHNNLHELRFDFKGRPCWAGAKSFTLDDQGRAWRCYPARRYRAQYLGNLLTEQFSLAEGPSPCLYSYCNCTVPIERQMMPR
jgi:MoaA/NifB/PqqE/SkfB family radical SAM enzyme